MYTIQHNPARLYNCDETGITIVQHKHTNILGLKGKRQISSVQSAERGSLVTVVNCMSPTGQFILPLLVFLRKYMKQEQKNGTPPGSIHACHPSEWTQSEIFTQYFLHFTKHTKSLKVKWALVQTLRLCTGRTAHRGSKCIALLFLDHSTRGGWGVSVTPWTLFTPGKTQYPLYRRLGGPHGRSGQVRKISLPLTKHTKPTKKKRSSYLGTGRTLYTHKEPWGHYFSSRE